MYELLTAKQLANRLGISMRTLQRWKSAGLLPPAIRLSERTIRWDWPTVVEWLEQKRRPSLRTRRVSRTQKQGV